MSTGLPLSAVPRPAGAIVVGAAAGALAGGVLSDASLGVLAGIAATETVFVVTGWLVLWPMDTAAAHRNARREDFRPVVEELVVVGAALCGLLATFVLLLRGGSDRDHAAAATALGGVFMAWAALHLMYAARYGYLYHAVPRAGSTSTPRTRRRTGTSSTSVTTWA